jgi:acyl-CoA synthetase (AMP-forming)/AMP-acid ligase II
VRTLVDLVPRIAARPHDAALVSSDTATMTVGEFLARVERLAAVLQDSGVRSGIRVGVHHGNGPDAVVAWFATWTAGGTVVPLNPRVATDELARITKTAEIDHVLTAPTGADHVPAGLPMTLHTGDEIRPSTTGAGTQRADSTPGADGEVALVQFTSGTTGAPKPVPLRHDTIVAMLNSVLGELAGTDRPRSEPMPNLIPVSLSLWAGIYNVLFAFTAGAPVVVMTAFEPTRFADLVQRFAIRSVVLPPAAMVMLSDTEQLMSLAPLRYVRSITAPLPPTEAVRFHERFGVAILNCYGQTELGGEVIGWTATDWKQHGVEKLGAVGKPHRGVEVRLVDDGRVHEGPDAVGELEVRTPSTKKDVSLLAEDRHGGEGFVRTGDLARIDDDGFVWIVGRRSSMINRGGLKIAPGDVEEVIRSVPGVVDAAVVGAPDRRLGEVPWAFVVWREGEAPDIAAIETRCREKLAGYKVPAGWTVIDALPRNEIGKIVPRDLLARLPEVKT